MITEGILDRNTTGYIMSNMITAGYIIPDMITASHITPDDVSHYRIQKCPCLFSGTQRKSSRISTFLQETQVTLHVCRNTGVLDIRDSETSV